jgi:hypothetical protein
MAISEDTNFRSSADSLHYSEFGVSLRRAARRIVGLSGFFILMARSLAAAAAMAG